MTIGDSGAGFDPRGASGRAAEGVETEQQAKFLDLLRCDEMQGYLFSRPLPGDQLLKLLRQR